MFNRLPQKSKQNSTTAHTRRKHQNCSWLVFQGQELETIVFIFQQDALAHVFAANSREMLSRKPGARACRTARPQKI